jgi:hypothetical protein
MQNQVRKWIGSPEGIGYGVQVHSLKTLRNVTHGVMLEDGDAIYQGALNQVVSGNRIDCATLQTKPLERSKKNEAAPQRIKLSTGEIDSTLGNAAQEAGNYTVSEEQQGAQVFKQKNSEIQRNQ